MTRECTISIIHTSYTIPLAMQIQQTGVNRPARIDAYSQTQTHATTNTREREERGREAEHAG